MVLPVSCVRQTVLRRFQLPPRRGGGGRVASSGCRPDPSCRPGGWQAFAARRPRPARPSARDV